MKATITESGVLTISPETHLEAYALKCWCETTDKFIENIKIETEIEAQSD